MSAGEAFGLSAVRDQVAGMWLRDVAAEALEGLLDGRVTACRHLIDGTSPRGLLIAAERHHVLCLACATPAMQAISGTFEDHRCDVCGRPAERLRAFLLDVGPFLVTGGACARCSPAVVQLDGAA